MNEITKVEVQKKNKDRFNIYVDNSFLIGISSNTLIEMNLFTGKTVDKNKLYDIIKKEDYNKAFSYALSFLGYRMRSVKEMELKLKEKEFEQNTIEDVIFKLVELNYLNDKDFSEAFIRTRINSKKYGPIKIKYDLISKGVSDTIIDNSLQDIYTYELEYDICSLVAKKKKYKKDEEYKLYNFLRNRGFNSSVINDVIN